MALHIDEITSEVLTEGEPVQTAPESSDTAAACQRVVDQLARLAEDRRRVAAEGFDD